MYFSLITPAPGLEREAAHDWLGGAYGEHQWLWRFFPAPDGTRRDFLFRRRDVDGLPRFYVVSTRAPKVASPAWNVQTRPYQPRLQRGARLTFDLRANPVVSRTENGKAYRHDVVMDAKKRLLNERGLSHWNEWRPDRLTKDGQPDPRPSLYDLVQQTCVAWLAARAKDHGFELVPSAVTASAYQQHAGKHGELRFSTVDISGELVVTDGERFARALTQGVGRAKAFGCGLLLVRSAS